MKEVITGIALVAVRTAKKEVQKHAPLYICTMVTYGATIVVLRRLGGVEELPAIWIAAPIGISLSFAEVYVVRRIFPRKKKNNQT